jgi:hypothetical protein
VSLEKIREKARKHNTVVRKLEDAGFVYCSGLIFTGESFNRETCTWQPNSQRIGELVWEDDQWAVKPYTGFSHLLKDFCPPNQGGEGSGHDVT